MVLMHTRHWANWKRGGLTIALFLLSCMPPVNIILQTLQQNLGADPAKEIVLKLGFWAAVLLWLTLSASTLKRRAHSIILLQHRRMLGLFAAFYAMLHFLAYCTFILGWRFELLATELSKRPYIVVGAMAVLLLLPLVVTSTKKMQRRLGRRWRRLHQLIYPIAILVALHIIWMIRASYTEALVFTLLLIVMFIDRILAFRGRRKPKND